MNKKERSEISALIKKLNISMDIVNDVSDKMDDIRYDQESIFDNIPENLQNSERAERQENVVELLNEACDSLSSISGYIEEAIDKMNEAINA